MTLAIAVVTADGIAIAADSRTTVQWKTGPADVLPRVVSDFTHKVFRVGNVAVATYGFALVLRRNVAGHVTDFVATVPDSSSAREVAEQLHAFFSQRLEDHFNQGFDQRPPPGDSVLGFLVGGYENEAGVLYEVTLPGNVERLSDSTTGGAAWRGQTDVVSRLIKGVDYDLLHGLSAGTPDEAHVVALQQRCLQMEYLIPFGSMNLQDAIDFAVLAIRTTIDVQRLSHGVVAKVGSWPGVGGPIEIAAVLPTEGFKWIQRTDLQGERPAGDAIRT